jgi:hypothetical protein
VFPAPVKLLAAGVLHAGIRTPVGLPKAFEISGVLPNSGGEAGEKGRAQGGGFDIRRPGYGFTEDVGLDLHWKIVGRNAAVGAHYLGESAHLAPDQTARFHTKSGLLTATQEGGMIELDSPATPAEAADAPPGLLEALGTGAVYTGKLRFD